MKFVHISLIGMSGSGKSEWSIKLSEIGFKRFCCDDLIIEKLASELNRTDGTSMELGEWMGFPYDAHYKERESKYLTCEIEAMSEILDDLENYDKYIEKNIVVDTTGSVIYTGENTLKRLRRCTTVVHLSTPPEVQDLMLKAYIANRRPVLWMDLFKKDLNEENGETLARCYPKLLFHRERLYERYADVTIDYYKHYHDKFELDDFLNIDII
jgi:shikimate kinase